jgi:hypothetical protein
VRPGHGSAPAGRQEPVRRSECCMADVDSSTSDRRLHRRAHDEAVNGLRRAAPRNCPVVWRSDSRPVVVITSDSPRAHRRLAQEVSLVAAGDVDFLRCCVLCRRAGRTTVRFNFLGVEGDRATAYACLERRSHFWQCTWTEHDAGVTHPLDSRTMWSVGYAWVSRGNRRTGCAARWSFPPRIGQH